MEQSADGAVPASTGGAAVPSARPGAAAQQGERFGAGTAMEQSADGAVPASTGGAAVPSARPGAAAQQGERFGAGTAMEQSADGAVPASTGGAAVPSARPGAAAQQGERFGAASEQSLAGHPEPRPTSATRSASAVVDRPAGEVWSTVAVAVDGGTASTPAVSDRTPELARLATSATVAPIPPGANRPQL